MTTIETLRAALAAAEKREHEAAMDKHRVLAEIAGIEGRDADREYHEAFVAAQTHQPGGHERFWAICRRRDALDVIAGRTKVDDYIHWERPGIAAEVERMKAGSCGVPQAEPGDAAAHGALAAIPGPQEA